MSQTTLAGRVSLPDNGGSQKLTQFSLDNLMSALDSERNRAGEKYERLHRRLVKWFEGRGAFVAEELADETLDRVARKLSEEEIQKIPAYTFGVARNVLRESYHRQPMEALSDDLASPSGSDEHGFEKRLDCLEPCTGRLPVEHRELVMQYYSKDKGEKIEHRREIAQRLNVSIGALRTQVSRIRARLYRCVVSCAVMPDSSVGAMRGLEID